MLHTKCHVNRLAGSGEEVFRRVFTICGHGGHLGYVTSIMSSDFHFLVSESFHTKFGSDIGTEVFEKIWFEFLYLHTVCQGQEITLTFNTHISSYIQLDVTCSYRKT